MPRDNSKSREYKKRFCKEHSNGVERTWYQAHLYSKDNSELPPGALGEFRDSNICWQKVTQRESLLTKGPTLSFDETAHTNPPESITNTSVSFPEFETTIETDPNASSAISFAPMYSAKLDPDHRAFGRSKPIKQKH